LAGGVAGGGSLKIRERSERWELEWLSPHASKSALSRGRARPEEPCPIRTGFQRDRDRIVHSKAFRRLKHKTQVFIAPEGDHYRTRLTHTLEVAQVARTVARALLLNEDLAEAIALGHDLGHTPFGHLGEDVLDERLKGLVARGEWQPAGGPSEAGFRHASQSLRVVDLLEGERGLNLTWEVRDGIRQHSEDGCPATLEGQVVQLADRIAYLNHDIDDAVRAGVLRVEQIPPGALQALGSKHSQRINTLVVDLIRQGVEGGRVTFSPDVGRAADALERFMFEQVYLGPATEPARRRAARLLRLLFAHFLAHPGELAGPFDGGRARDGEVPRAAADYIAGMTDRFAIAQFERVFAPEKWRAE
jgi:dGTPase